MPASARMLAPARPSAPTAPPVARRGHAVPPPRPAGGGRELPPARRGAAGDRRPLRGEGEPRAGGCSPRCARRAAGSTWPARPRCSRRWQPARAPARPRLLQPGQAPLRHRVRGRAAASGCSSSTPPRRPPRSPPPPRTASVLCRLVTSGEGSDWPLSRKYGCSTTQAVDVLRYAASLGLDPAGVSFHVGSQQRDPRGLGRADRRQRPRLHGPARVRGHPPAPARPRRRVPGPPGRGLPAAGGVRRRDRPAPRPALRRPVPTPWSSPAAASSPTRACWSPRCSPSSAAATPGGSSSTPVSSPAWSRPWTRPSATRSRPTATAGRTGPCVVAGPTCDSTDVLYERAMVDLPLDLSEGDTVRLLGAGAYTTCYSTVGFNGFPPLPTHLAS